MLEPVKGASNPHRAPRPPRAGTPCDQAALLIPPPARAPRLRLLPNAATLFLPYGRPPAFSLMPCANGSATAACGAAASELGADGNETADLSAAIEVRDTTSCDSNAVRGTQRAVGCTRPPRPVQGPCACAPGCTPSYTPPLCARQACVSCSAESLTAGGICLPGAYTLTYAVAAPGGRGRAEATRRVIVYQAGRVSGSFDLHAALGAGEAAAVVAAIRDTSSEGYAAARAAVAGRLRAAGAGVRASDVSVDAARAVPLYPGSRDARVAVDATVHVYFPPEVGKQLLETGTADSSRRRRRRLGERPAGGALAGAAAGEEAGAALPPAAARAHELLARYRDLAGALAAHAADSGGAAAADDCGAAPHGAACALAALGAAPPRALARRALLQGGGGGGGLGGSLDALSGAMQDGLGVASPTSASDTAEVDVVGGYLAALASGVALLEERAGALAAGAAAVEARVEQTFGAEAQQREGTRDAEVQSLYQVGGAGARAGRGQRARAAAPFGPHLRAAQVGGRSGCPSAAAVRATLLTATPRCAAPRPGPQSLLTDWNALVSAVSGLAGRAASGFDKQAAAFAALAGAMGDTINSMREAASYAEQLLEEYVQQQAMLDAATGAARGPGPGCSRPATFAVRFNVSGGGDGGDSSGDDAPAPAGGTRRRLARAAGGGDDSDADAGDGAGAGDSVRLISDELVEWDGYQLAARARAANWGADVNTAATPERARHLGAAGANRVVGGLFLHATRRAGGANTACAPGSRAAALAFECSPAAAARAPPAPGAAAGAAAAAAGYAAWLAARDAPLAPYGVDPAFLRPSALYRPDLAGLEALYYNTSDARDVSPATGAPHGFHHAPLRGYADGFPVLIVNRLAAARAAAAVQYLLDGNYLDGCARARCARGAWPPRRAARLPAAQRAGAGQAGARAA